MTLAAHTMIAVPTTSLFLFQMAMLEASMRFVWERRPQIGRTVDNVHAKNNQEGSGDGAQITNSLENAVRSSLPRHRSILEKNLRVEVYSKPRVVASRCCNDTDVGRSTHLTIDWGGAVKSNKVENYGHEGGHTRKRVDLRTKDFNISR